MPSNTAKTDIGSAARARHVPTACHYCIFPDTPTFASSKRISS
jgi:hypothetical protein